MLWCGAHHAQSAQSHGAGILLQDVGTHTQWGRADCCGAVIYVTFSFYVIVPTWLHRGVSIGFLSKGDESCSVYTGVCVCVGGRRGVVCA